MSTPCEDRGYKVGQVFRDKRDGELAVLHKDDGTDMPYFFSLTGRNWSPPISQMERIYPPEPVETIELWGKTYDKAEIEKALSGVMPVS